MATCGGRAMGRQCLVFGARSFATVVGVCRPPRRPPCMQLGGCAVSTLDQQLGRGRPILCLCHLLETEQSKTHILDTAQKFAGRPCATRLAAVVGLLGRRQPHIRAMCRERVDVSRIGMRRLWRTVSGQGETYGASGRVNITGMTRLRISPVKCVRAVSSWPI